jgi:serine/threonine-protein kinase
VIVGGRFRLERPIAKGGMGEVWAGEHRTTGMRVALKMLLPEMSSNIEVVQRFKREAVLLGRVRSDRVARVIDFFLDARCGAVLVTEFIEGCPLSDAKNSGPMNVEDAVGVGIEIARALHDLHQAHIVHRDLKPGNVIMQARDDGATRAVLVDLGVSRLVSPVEENTDALTDITRTQIVLGTLGYMAPEQILDPRNVTASADLYGLGAILFRLVSDRHVFDGMSLVEQMRAKLEEEAPQLRTGRADPLARGLEAIVSRALQRDPAKRYASADEMVEALSALRDVPGSALPVVEGDRLQALAPRRPRRGLVSAAAAFALLALAVAGVTGGARFASPSAHVSASQAPSPGPGDGLEPGADQNVCSAGGASGQFGPSRGSSAAPPPPVQARAMPTQRERDAALMRAIRSAVQAEAYMTLSVPQRD